MSACFARVLFFAFIGIVQQTTHAPTHTYAEITIAVSKFVHSIECVTEIIKFVYIIVCSLAGADSVLLDHSHFNDEIAHVE